MKLSVPFIPDPALIDSLKTHIRAIESIYFSMHEGPVLDARMRFRKLCLDDLARELAKVRSPKKYLLMNTRFIHPARYHDQDFLNDLAGRVEFLAEHAGLTGFVFSDAYLLTALKNTRNTAIRELEAVPGINCMIDTPDKLFAYLELIEDNGFARPSKCIPDRALNRDLKALETISRQVKKECPDIRIELLANEGCIFHCPYKLAHDSQIAYANLPPENNQTRKGNLTFAANQALGCHAWFFKHPYQVFKSPFIRPEDVSAYAPFADAIKLCGRTLGVRFLKRCLAAYTEQSWDGNLLELMDASNWLADRYHIDNKSLDPGFLNMVTKCTKICKNCHHCSDLFKRAAEQLYLRLRKYKDYQ